MRLYGLDEVRVFKHLYFAIGLCDDVVVFWLSCKEFSHAEIEKYLFDFVVILKLINLIFIEICYEIRIP